MLPSPSFPIRAPALGQPDTVSVSNACSEPHADIRNAGTSPSSTLTSSPQSSCYHLLTASHPRQFPTFAPPLLYTAAHRSFFFFFFFFLGPQWRHMEIPGCMGQIGAAAASLSHSHSHTGSEPSHIFNLHSSLWQCWILNPLSEARDQTCNLMDTSRVLNLQSHNRKSPVVLLKTQIRSYLFCVLLQTLQRFSISFPTKAYPSGPYCS